MDAAAAAPPPFKPGDPLLRRPRHQWSFDVMAVRGPLTAWVRGGGRGHVLDVEPTLGTFGGLFDAAGYAVWNLGGSWTFKRRLELFGRIENLFDRVVRGGVRLPGARPRRDGRYPRCCRSLTSGSPTTSERRRTRRCCGASRWMFRPTASSASSGPNGSGKSTLLRLLAGTRRPQRGRIALDGVPLSDLSRAVLAQRMAVVPQETHLAFDYTAGEVAMMGRYPHLRAFEIEGPADLDIVDRALAATGTGHLKHRRFDTLSGGEKQRVIIAAALAQLQSPDRRRAAGAGILLLDEPTASLDLAYQLEVAALLRTLHQEQGVAIVLSTHDLNLASSLCRTLILLRAGTIVALGPTSDILTRKNIRQLYGVDAEVIDHASGHRVVIPVAHTGVGSRG